MINYVIWKEDSFIHFFSDLFWNALACLCSRWWLHYIFFYSKELCSCFIALLIFKVFLFQTHYLPGFLTKIAHKVSCSRCVHFFRALFLSSLIVESFTQSIQIRIVRYRASSIMNFIDVAQIPISSSFLGIKLFTWEYSPRSKLP